MTKHPRIPATGADSFRCTFVDGAFLEILGHSDEAYRVDFLDAATQTLIHRAHVRTNHWARTARQYFTRWQIDVFRERDDALVFSQHFRCRGRRVYVAIESKALGDTLAWMPAVDAFRRRHGCEVVCSTFMNDLFRPTHPQLTFVEPGTTVQDLHAMYRLGWFYRDDGEADLDRNVRDFRRQPLAASACDILGLPYVETRPRLARVAGPPPVPGRYVCVAIHGTAQAKYWNHPDGWAAVTRFLTERGYRVLLLSREGSEYMGNRAPADMTPVPEGSLEDVVRYLQGASMFIGIGSGLAWLAWAVGCRTCLISGFSQPYSEMEDCIRIFPKETVCAGCYNEHRLDPDDWNWCPEHRDTPRMFECTRAIPPEQVIEAIEPHL